MTVDNVGQVFPWQVSDALAEDLSPVIFEWRFVNRAPLYTRMRQVPARQQEFHTVVGSVRPDYVQLAANALATDTTLTLADATPLYNGDILEYVTPTTGVPELMEVATDPNVQTQVITVRRGDAGTTAVALTSGFMLRILGNSRTGGENNQRGIAPTVAKGINWIQNMDHPVEVAGILQDTPNFITEVIEAGATDPLDAFRMNALGNMVLANEKTLIYQRGVAPTGVATNRAKTKGIKQQIQDAGTINGYTPYRWQPTNFAAYGPVDLVRDVIQGPAGQGGSANLLVASTDFIGGFATWKIALTRIDMGVTRFNVVIEAFESPGVPNMTVLLDPALRPGTLIALNDQDLILRYLRLPTWYPRGRQGDSAAGDLIERIGVQVNNPAMARFIEGITGFAAP